MPVVSFVFGCPAPDCDRRAARGAAPTVWVTVTSPAEARQAEDAGADALVVQGYEAGGHRASFSDGDEAAYGLLALLQLVGAHASVPLVATGGIATGRGVAAALAAGARAAQIGTAFLRCPEAGTSAVHRAALATAAPTALTRAFTGKSARGIVNRFMREHGDAAPRAYPELHHVTAPLRQAARDERRSRRREPLGGAGARARQRRARRGRRAPACRRGSHRLATRERPARRVALASIAGRERREEAVRAL